MPSSDPPPSDDRSSGDPVISPTRVRIEDSATVVVFIAMAFICAAVVVGFYVGGRIRIFANASPVACDHRDTVRVGDTLESVAIQHFGDPGYRWAILTATNLKAGTAPYTFIRNPFQLKVGESLCIPERSQAQVLRERYDRYLKAGQAAQLSDPVARDVPLASVDPQTCTLVAWTRRDVAYELQASKKLKNETWVTASPHVKNFCRRYVRSHAPEPPDLTLRLEQRLGLPPATNNTVFVEFRLKLGAGANPILFRPCGDPRTSTERCPSTFLLKTADFNKTLDDGTSRNDGTTRDSIKNLYWYLYRYHASYSEASPYQYPWTGAGYTFDWAPAGDDGERFVRWGESEFVVAAEALIDDVKIVDTADYCSPG